MRVRFAGGGQESTLAGSDELPTKTNYYSTPARQIRLPGDTSPAGARENAGSQSGRGLAIENVPNYRRVIEKNVYPGVDVVYYGNAGELEYDFVVAPGAKTDQIRLKFSGIERLRINPTGDLVLHTKAGDLNQLRPRVYESTAAGKREINGRYVVFARDEVGFRLERESRDSAIVIDPVLNFSTYFGSTADEQAKGVGVDAAGNAYIAGTSTNAALVDTGFISKYSPTGTKLFTTYISGGCTYTDVLGIAVDSSGNSYLTGYVQPKLSTGCDNDRVLALKVNTSGAIVNTYGGFFPGGGDQGNGIAVDASGNAYITGQESSTSSFPITPGAFMTSTGAWIGFVSKLDPTGQKFVYSTFLGGTTTGDTCNAIAVDKAGNAYITGFGFSSDFPLHNPYQSKMNAFTGDAVFTVLNAAGSALNYSTYLGGTNGAGQGDQGNAIAVDAAGNAYVAGQTKSPDFPVTAGAYDKQCGTDGLCNPVNTGTGFQLLDDAFVAKFNPSLSGTTSLIYSTFLGGSGIDIGRGIAIDGFGNAYVTGSTISPDFPTLNPLHTYIGGYDVFLTKLNSTGSGLLFSTFFGGTGDDDGYGIAMDSGGNIFVAGSTGSRNFPVRNAAQSTFGGGNSDAFLFKLGTASAAPVLKSLALAPNPVIAGQTSTGTVTLTAAAPAAGASVMLSSSVTTAAKVPASVTVLAGSTSATFSVSTLNVSVSTPSTISARYGGVTQSVALTVKPITLSMLSIHPSAVTGGTSATGTVTLTAAALGGGAVVTLSSGNTGAATVPAAVTVGAGKTSASFAITTHPVSVTTKAAISATYHGTVSISLTVDPPALSALSLAPASVIGGSPSTGTVTLTGPAPKSGTVVTLTYGSSVASGPASVTVAAGVSKGTFTVTTKKVSTSTAVKITAAQAGVNKAATLTVLP